MEKKFLQFELWKNCHVNCKFCFNKYQPTFNAENKLKNLQRIINILKTDEINNYNELGFIGGEFFGGQLDQKKVEDKFYEALEIIANLLKTNKLNKFYIATSLIFDIKDYFQKFIDFFIDNKLLKRLCICTSYDTFGRFKSNKEEELWQMNMLYLHNQYPMLELHTQIIITEDFIQKVLKNEFDIQNFSKKFNTSIDYNIPHTGYDYRNKEEFDKYVPNFLPKRNDFLNFLKKTIILDKSINILDFFANEKKANTIHVLYNSTNYIATNKNIETLLPFGLYKKAGYIDSNINIWDDVEKLKKELS